MWENLKLTWSRLGDPAYQTIILEPLFYWGIGIGLVVFLVAFILKESKTQKVGLLIVILSCLAVLPYMHHRIAVAPDIESLMPGVSETLRANEEIRGDSQWVFLTLAGLATLTFFLCRGGKAGVWLTAITVAAGIGAVFLGISMRMNDALVFYPHLENSAPAGAAPPAPAPTPAKPAAASDAEATVAVPQQ